MSSFIRYCTFNTFAPRGHLSSSTPEMGEHSLFMSLKSLITTLIVYLI